MCKWAHLVAILTRKVLSINTMLFDAYNTSNHCYDAIIYYDLQVTHSRFSLLAANQLGCF